MDSPQSPEATLDEELNAFFAGDAGVCGNPYPLFGRLRAESPVRFLAPELVTVATHAEATAVYRDGHTFGQFKGASGFSDDFLLLGPDEVGRFDSVTAERGRSMVAQDGAVHRRIGRPSTSASRHGGSPPWARSRSG